MVREEVQGQLQREHAALEEAQATLKIRDLEITRLSGELVQEDVSYEELRQAGEEKDASILELQQAAEAACAALETEKKRVRVSYLSHLSPAGLIHLVSAPNLTCSWFLGLRTALGNSTT
jgi:cell division inhibitor SulA